MKRPKPPQEVTARGPNAPTYDKRRTMAIDPQERMPQITGVQHKPDPQWAIDDRRRRKIFAQREAEGRISRKTIKVPNPDGTEGTIITSTSSKD